MAELAATAGVRPATLYQRFANPDVLGSVLLELYYRRVEDWARQPRRGGDRTGLLPALDALAQGAFEQVQALGHVMRPAYLYSRRYPERAGPEWSRLEALARAGYRAFVEAHAGEIREPDRDEAARVLCQLFNLQVLGLLLHGPQPREQFTRDLVTLAHRYLAGPCAP